MRRRLVGLALGGLLVAGCSDAERPSTESASTSTSVVPDEPVAGPVGRILRRAEGVDEAAFRATFSVLRKLGGDGGAVSVDVTGARGSNRIVVEDLLLIITGPKPATCSVSALRCVGEVREEQLAPYGIFTGFWSTGPAQALRTLVARDDAGRPTRSTRTVAGQELDCVSVPVGTGVPNTSCVTFQGVFGYVDTPSVRIELTEYVAGPSVTDQVVPFPITDDDSFLSDPTSGSR